jgi:hypothetical protein
VDAWNATVQRQVTNSISAEIAYVGSKGTHGFAGNGPNYDVNPARVGPGTDPTQAFLVSNPKVPCLPGSTPNFGNCGPATYAGFTPTVSQNSRRPLFPAIPFDLGNYYGNDAASTYNAFEAKIEKRFSQGLQFVSHYTFAHAYNYTDSYYAGSHSVAWGPVDFNRNQVWVFNTVYELPFGKGKSYLGSSGRGMDYVVGGWQVSNTTNWSRITLDREFRRVRKRARYRPMPSEQRRFWFVQPKARFARPDHSHDYVLYAASPNGLSGC